jgi:hypothetical protein
VIQSLTDGLFLPYFRTICRPKRKAGALTLPLDYDTRFADIRDTEGQLRRSSVYLKYIMLARTWGSPLFERHCARKNANGLDGQHVEKLLAGFQRLSMPWAHCITAGFRLSSTMTYEVAIHLAVFRPSYTNII